MDKFSDWAWLSFYILITYACTIPLIERIPPERWRPNWWKINPWWYNSLTGLIAAWFFLLVGIVWVFAV